MSNETMTTLSAAIEPVIERMHPQISMAHLPTAQTWYAMSAAEGDTATIDIYDEIGGFGVTASKFVNDLKGINAKTIKVRLNTPGGEVFDGTAIHNALRAHPAHVVIQIDGVAASAGSFIAMSGDEVHMADNAYLMIHNAWGGIAGGAEELRSYAGMLDKINDNIAGMYETKSGKPRKHWRGLMDAETWFTAKEAKAEGLVDKVIDYSEPASRARSLAAAKVYNKIPDPVRSLWGLTQNNSQPEPVSVSSDAAAPVAHSQEPKSMATEPNAAPAQTPAAGTGTVSQGDRERFEQSAIDNYIARGREYGNAEGRKASEDRMRAIFAACPGKPEIAINAFLSGQSAETAQLIFEASSKAEIASREKLSAQEVENARLHALLAAGGHGGVGVRPSQPDHDVAPTGLDPQAQADMEWDTKPMVRSMGMTEKQWKLYRVNQLAGNVRVLSKTA